MGGRGGASGMGVAANAGSSGGFVLGPAPVVQGPQVAQQVPDDDNTPVNVSPLSALAGMNDAQLAQVFKDSQKVVLPNHLGDYNDQTQKFIFAIGMNEKPMVLDAAEFNQFMADNRINPTQVMARSINSGTLKTSAGNTRNYTPQDIADMLMYSKLNYIGGKLGGQAFGAGTYFDMNGGRNTGYGGKTVTAVLNPKTARVITSSKLATLAQNFDATHPQFAKATGGYSTSFYNNNMSIYATVLGYNVIKDSYGSYHNVIDRAALVYKK